MNKIDCYWAVGTIAVAIFGLSVMIGFIYAEEPVAKVPFSQADFPCQEDEVLGFHPTFGPDNVGCIHVDVLKASS